MRDFKNLKVWEKAHALTLKIYEISKHFNSEKFGLVSQLRRAAASISTNIAERLWQGYRSGFCEIYDHCRRFNQRS
ncbi:MAG: four helix bundle protein [Calditrichia bacterium]